MKPVGVRGGAQSVTEQALHTPGTKLDLGGLVGHAPAASAMMKRNFKSFVSSGRS